MHIYRSQVDCSCTLIVSPLRLRNHCFIYSCVNSTLYRLWLVFSYPAGAHSQCIRNLVYLTAEIYFLSDVLSINRNVRIIHHGRIAYTTYRVGDVGECTVGQGKAADLVIGQAGQIKHIWRTIDMHIAYVDRGEHRHKATGADIFIIECAIDSRRDDV